MIKNELKLSIGRRTLFSGLFPVKLQMPETHGILGWKTGLITGKCLLHLFQAFRQLPGLLGRGR